MNMYAVSCQTLFLSCSSVGYEGFTANMHTLPSDQDLGGFDDLMDAGGGVAVGHVGILWQISCFFYKFRLQRSNMLRIMSCNCDKHVANDLLGMNDECRSLCRL